MDEVSLLKRISSDPAVLGGKPVVCGTRLSVEFILSLLAHGAKTQEILDEYKGLIDDDIRACFLFASKSLSGTSFVPLTAESM